MPRWKPFQEEMERIHEEMEPFHEEMELLGERIEAAIIGDVAAVLRSHLGPVTGPDAPFAEAAARIIDDAQHPHPRRSSSSSTRRGARCGRSSRDLFTPCRVGTQDAFDDALANTVDEVSDLEIRTD